MVLQGLRKIVESYESQLGIKEIKQLTLLRNLPFYNFDNAVDANTFNHNIGLPQKNCKSYPLFDYE